MAINKCEHGLYIPAGELRAPYCQLCTPGGPADTRPVVLPRMSSDSLSNAGRVMANNQRDNSCPECSSTIYLRVNENGSDANRECADCGTQYRARITAHRQALMVEEAADESR